MLQSDKSVLVVASDVYGRRYDKLFRSYGFMNFEIRSWQEELFKCSKKILNWWERYKEHYQKDIITFVYTYVKRYHTYQLKEITNWLLTFDFIMIDDASDQVSFGFWQIPVVCLII